jgi:hypothetical protein
MDNIPTRHLPMVCDCGERKVDAEALYEEVRRRLELGSENLRPGTVANRDFLSAVVHSLHQDLRTHVHRIGVDQWFVIAAEHLNADDLDERIVVQCDRPEYGLAAIWKALADEKGLALLP